MPLRVGAFIPLLTIVDVITYDDLLRQLERVLDQLRSNR